MAGSKEGNCYCYYKLCNLPYIALHEEEAVAWNKEKKAEKKSGWPEKHLCYVDIHGDIFRHLLMDFVTRLSGCLQRGQFWTPHWRSVTAWRTGVQRRTTPTCQTQKRRTSLLLWWELVVCVASLSSPTHIESEKQGDNHQNAASRDAGSECANFTYSQNQLHWNCHDSVLFVVLNLMFPLLFIFLSCVSFILKFLIVLML